MTKKKTVLKSISKNSITVIFICPLISSVCRFICDMSYSHDKNIAEFFEIFFLKNSHHLQTTKQFTKKNYHKIVDK